MRHVLVSKIQKNALYENSTNIYTKNYTITIRTYVCMCSHQLKHKYMRTLLAETHDPKEYGTIQD